MQNTYVNDLIAFIKANVDWREKLLDKPFSLKNIVDVPYHKDWYMFNYNLFESDLSNSVVKSCRGTILEISPDRSVVKVVCLPFYKFFNYGDVNGDTIDWSTAKTRLKVDGQLIKMFKYEGMGEYAGFWSAQNGRNKTIWLWSMGRMSDKMVRQLAPGENHGYSVRCIEGN